MLTLLGAVYQVLLILLRPAEYINSLENFG